MMKVLRNKQNPRVAFLVPDDATNDGDPRAQMFNPEAHASDEEALSWCDGFAEGVKANNRPRFPLNVDVTELAELASLTTKTIENCLTPDASTQETHQFVLERSLGGIMLQLARIADALEGAESPQKGGE